MANLPTPRISGQFNGANTSVSGTVTWPSQTNLEDLDQVRVRYARRSGTGQPAPSRADVINRSENTGGWSSFTSGGRTYQYRDDVIRSGFDNTPPSYGDRTVTFSEASLSGYTVWGVPRLEV